MYWLARGRSFFVLGAPPPEEGAPDPCPEDLRIGVGGGFCEPGGRGEHFGESGSPTPPLPALLRDFLLPIPDRGAPPCPPDKAGSVEADRRGWCVPEDKEVPSTGVEDEEEHTPMPAGWLLLADCRRDDEAPRLPTESTQKHAHAGGETVRRTSLEGTALPE